MQIFAVKARYGRGYRVIGATECPNFNIRSKAIRYAELRSEGMSHEQAWDVVSQETKANKGE